MSEVAFVTGAGSGIGRATALRLAARGARVGVFDRSAEAAARVAAEIGDALALPGDVTDDRSVAAAIAEIEVAFGPLTTAVAAAGVEVQGTILDIELEDWQRSLAVNLGGVFSVARHAVPRLIRRGGGTFTAVASDVGVQGSPGEIAYSAAKHGVVGLVRCLAIDHGRQGVRANAVCPGFVATPMTDRLFADRAAPERGAAADAIPLGAFARPEEIAAVIAHLSSDEATHTNGLVYVVDGGASA